MEQAARIRTLLGTEETSLATKGVMYDLKIKRHITATAGLMSASLILLLFIACLERPTPDPPVVAASPGRSSESWQCSNDLEVRCGEGRCEAEAGDGFTPMSVSADDSGAMSVCAYSGCWEGSGEVVQSEEFLVLIGHDLEFSTSRDSESAQENIVIVIDRTDGVATLKAGEFAHPLLCESSGRAQ